MEYSDYGNDNTCDFDCGGAGAYRDPGTGSGTSFAAVHSGYGPDRAGAADYPAHSKMEAQIPETG